MFRRARALMLRIGKRSWLYSIVTDTFSPLSYNSANGCLTWKLAFISFHFLSSSYFSVCPDSTTRGKLEMQHKTAFGSLIVNIIPRSVNFSPSEMFNRFNHLTSDDRIIGTLKLQIEVVQTVLPSRREGSVERFVRWSCTYFIYQIKFT